MIKAIIAIDIKRGLADDNGIPWDLPTDRKYFRDQTANSNVLMGYGTYKEFDKPWGDRTSYVASDRDVELMGGYKLVKDARKFVQTFDGELWIIGGAGLLAHTLDLCDELYITQLKGDFNCTKFIPDYHDQFELVQAEAPQTENGIEFSFQVWRRK